MQTQLVLAPLFLRKGLLKKRVDEILAEVSMSRRRLISCLVASSLTLLLAAGVGVWMFPLETRGQTQTLSAEPIQVVQGGENLVHRAPLVYPGRAIERRVAGDVLLEVSLDENGQVSDARVLSGPAELRSPCLRSVLEWRYSTPMPETIQVLIRFQLPKDGTASEVVVPGVPEEKIAYYTVTGPAGFSVTANGELTPGQLVERQIKEIQAGLADPKAAVADRAMMERQLVEKQAELERIHAGQSGDQTRVFVMADTSSAETIKKQIEELRTGLADPSTTQENRQRMKKQLAEREAQLIQQANEPNAGAGYIYLNTIVDQAINGKLVAIRAERVPQATQEVLFPRLGVHVGDTITEQVAQQVRQRVSSFDVQLRALFHADEKGNVTLVIVGR
jgi:TonB family protein